MLEIRYLGKPKCQTGIYATFRQHLSMASFLPCGAAHSLYYLHPPGIWV